MKRTAVLCGVAFLVSVHICFCDVISMADIAESLKTATEDIGGFELSPVQPGQYWYDPETKTFSYNDYRIDVACDPVPARILINDQLIGSAPGPCFFTGRIDGDDFVIIKAVPIDPGFKDDKKVIKGSAPLPDALSFVVKR